eukprot:403342674
MKERENINRMTLRLPEEAEEDMRSIRMSTHQHRAPANYIDDDDVIMQQSMEDVMQKLKYSDKESIRSQSKSPKTRVKASYSAVKQSQASNKNDTSKLSQSKNRK